MKMRIVFPYIGSENLGICYLSGMLKAHGYETMLAFEPSLFDDTKFLHLPIIPRLFHYNEKFADHIVRMKPQVLAFSVFSMNYLWALDIARRVKKKLEVVTVFGGVHVQAVPQRVLANTQVDYVILGEGEYALLEFVQSLEKGEVDLSIRNLGYRRNGEMHFNPVRPLMENLDELPLPDREMFAPVEDYKTGILYLCGRGCAFSCSFCCNAMIRQQFPNPAKYVRMQSVERCIKELAMLKERYAPGSFQLQDDVFTLNKQWLKEFCARYPLEVGVPFQVTGYPGVIQEEDIALLKKAGCYFLQIGVQSFNPENRKRILHRHESNDDVANCVNWCRQYDMGISLDYIFFPWEANETDQLNAAHFFHRNPPTRIANFYLSYLPSTEIVAYALENGYLRPEDMEAVETGKNAYYHAGGDMCKDSDKLKLFNNFYNFFLLLLMVPYCFGSVLFKCRAYRFARYIPKTLLLVMKEVFLPIFSKGFRESPIFTKYVRYYARNIKVMLRSNFH